MPRYQLTPPKPGERLPGAGRAKGTPNKITVEARELVAQLVNDLHYQHRLRADFRARKVHPTIEALIWQMHLGRPRQQIDIAATVDIDATARLVEERHAFAVLDVRDLEQLAAESQALVDRALALSAARTTPQHLAVGADLPKVSAESLGIQAGSDNSGYVVQDAPAEREGGSSDGSAS